MIIVYLAGGLGNQMFQYAFGRSLANRLGVELALDLSDSTLQIHNGFELDSVFNIQAKIATSSDLHYILGWQRFKTVRKLLKNLENFVDIRERYILEPHFHFSPKMLELRDNICLNGYWQSEKYFLNSVEDIRNDFVFHNSPSKLNESLITNILGSDYTAVSLHIRRGDFANNTNTNQVHGVCSLNYYTQAINYIADRIKKPYFHVFSDDIEWVKHHLNLLYPHSLIGHNRGKTSYEDMRLMSLCQHHIIANSSFSWWGAWLNPSTDKIVVAPKKWFADTERNSQDLIPEKWVKI